MEYVASIPQPHRHYSGITESSPASRGQPRNHRRRSPVAHMDEPGSWACTSTVAPVRVKLPNSQSFTDDSGRATGSTTRMPQSIAERLTILQHDARRFGYTDQADRLAQRVRDAAEPLLVMVVGEGNVGKSSLVNALVGKAVAPVSRLPKTWKVDLFQTGNPPRAELHWRSRPDRPDGMPVERAREVADAEEARLEAAGTSRSDLYQVRWVVDAPWPPRGVALVDTPGIAQLRADVSVRATTLHGAEGFEVQAEDPFLFWYTRADSVLWCVSASRLADEDARAALEATAHLGRRILGVVTHMDRVPRERWPEILDEAKRQFGKWIPEFVPVSAAGRDAAAVAETVPALRSRLEVQVAGVAAVLKERANEAFYARERAAFVEATGAIAEAWRANEARLTGAAAGIEAAGHAAQQGVEGALRVAFGEAREAAVRQLPKLWAQSGQDPAKFGEMVSAQAIDGGALGAAVQARLAASAAALEQGIRRSLRDLVWRAVRVGTSGTQVAARPAQVSWVQLSRTTVDGAVQVNIRGDEADGLAVGVGGAAALVGMAVLGPIGIAAGVIGWFVRGAFQEGEAKAKAQRAIEEHLQKAETAANNAAKAQLASAARQARDALSGSFQRWHGKPASALLGVLRDVDGAWERQGVDDGLDLRPVARWADGIGLSGLRRAWQVARHLDNHPLDAPMLVGEVEARWREALDRAFVAFVARALPYEERAQLRQQLTRELFDAVLREARGPAIPAFDRARLEVLLGVPVPLRAYLPEAADLLDDIPEAERTPLERLARLAGDRYTPAAFEFDTRVQSWRPSASAPPIDEVRLPPGSRVALGAGLSLAVASSAIATVAWGTVYAWSAAVPAALGAILMWVKGIDVLRTALRVRNRLAWQTADAAVEGWLRVAFADSVFRRGPFGTADPVVPDLAPLDEPLPPPADALPASPVRRVLVPATLCLVTAIAALFAAKVGGAFRPEFLGQLCNRGNSGSCVEVCEAGSGAAPCAEAAGSLSRYSGTAADVLTLLEAACERGDAAVCFHLAWARRSGDEAIPDEARLPWLTATAFPPDAAASEAAAKAACSLGELRGCVLGLADLDVASWPKLTGEQRSAVTAQCADGVVAACAVEALAARAGYLELPGATVRSRLGTACTGTQSSAALLRFCREGALSCLDPKLGRVDERAALSLFDAICPTESAACDDALALLLDRKRKTYDPAVAAARLIETCDAESSRLPPTAEGLGGCARLLTIGGKATPALAALRARLALCTVEDAKTSAGVCGTLGDALMAAGQAAWVPPISDELAERCLTKDRTICAIAGTVAMEAEPERALQLLARGCAEGEAPACDRVALWWRGGPRELTGAAAEAATELRNACGSGVHGACAGSLRFDAGGLTSGLALLDKPDLFGTAEIACAGGDAKACAALAFARSDRGEDGQPDWERACAAGCTDACDPGNDAQTCFDSAIGAQRATAPSGGTGPAEGLQLSE